MIQETEDGVVVSCDDCSTEIEFPFSNRERIRKHLVLHNWVFFQQGNGEYHFRCPCCVEDRQRRTTAPLRIPLVHSR